MAYIIGNGKNTDFWYEIWIDQKRLSDYVTDDQINNVKVVEYIDQGN